MSRQNSIEDVVRTPPKEEKGAKEKSGSKPMKNPRNTMGTQNFFAAIDRATVESLLLINSVLYLQASFDVLYRC